MQQSLYSQATLDYQRIEQAIKFLEKNFRDHPSLKEIAQSAAMSEFHFQKLFSRWVGISPKRFLQYLTVEYAKELLDESRDLLDVTFQSGLSSPGRLHDLFVTCEAVTPGDYKNRGGGIAIDFGFHPSPFGECLVLLTEKGVCGLAFVQDGNREDALEAFRKRWKNAVFNEDKSKTAPLVAQIFHLEGEKSAKPLHIHIRGTNFQVKVWEALLKIPVGQLHTYQDIARAIGRPAATRAVGTAVGQNQISFVIPCHRVLRANGRISGYAWGPTRKRIILGWEANHRQTLQA